MPVIKHVDAKAIFERAAGHPAEPKTIVVCDRLKTPEINNNMTMNGVHKPSSFTLVPRRREQFFI